MKIIFTVLALYFLYKLVFDLILPVSRATSQVRSKVREMQEFQQQQMHQQQTAAAQQAAPRPQSASTPQPSKGDYLDFEEVK